MDYTAEQATNTVLKTLKDQGQCGSCWAVSAVLTAELASARRGEAQKLSSQYILDYATGHVLYNDGATRHYVSTGCSGGWPHEAFQYMVTFGVAGEVEYCYLGCDHARRSVTFSHRPITAYRSYNPRDIATIDMLIRVLKDDGPLCCGFYVSDWDEWELRSSVWYEKEFVDGVRGASGHCAVIVGAYTGAEEQAQFEQPYIILRDSLGEVVLGDQGNIYVPFSLLASMSLVYAVA